MLSWIFRALRLGGVLTSPHATPSGLQMTPPNLPGTENRRKHGSPDFILIRNNHVTSTPQPSIKTAFLEVSKRKGMNSSPDICESEPKAQKQDNEKG